MSIKVDGIEELSVQLDGMGNYWNMREALLKAGALVERSAKQKVQAQSKDTGELSRSIKCAVDGKGTTCTVFTPLEYAPYVEYGTGKEAEGGNGRKDVPWHYQDEKGDWHTTSGQKPQPFLRPALTENENKITELLEGALFDD